MLFDSHAHLNNDGMSPEEIEERALSIEESDVDFMMDVGYDWPSTVLALEHAKKYSWCYAVAGVHPHDSETMTDEMLEALKQLILKDRVYLHEEGKEEFENDDPEGAKGFRQKNIKAIGEIGLDFHYDLSPRDVQRVWFRKQIRLAVELDMPIVIHAREADQEVMDILKEEGAFSKERIAGFPERPAPSEPVTYEIKDEKGRVVQTRTVDFSDCTGDARVDIHCFSGSRELGIEYVKLGAALGVDGPVTYKNNKKTVGVVQVIPTEFLMIETDSPYLSPAPYRGKPNRSEYVEHVARKIAEIKGQSYEDVALTTQRNGIRFFDIQF